MVHYRSFLNLVFLITIFLKISWALHFLHWTLNNIVHFRVYNIWMLPIKAILALRVILSINKKRPKSNEIHHQFNFHVLYLCYTAKLALMISLLNKKKVSFFFYKFLLEYSICIANFLQQNKMSWCNSQACSLHALMQPCSQVCTVCIHIC